MHDEHTLLLPDRRGNNRVDSLCNVVRDPRVALCFLIPGSGSTLRVNGRAFLETDKALLDTFAVEEKAPRSVMVIEVGEIYFQCARAIVRSRLWDQAAHVDPKTLPPRANPRRHERRPRRRRRIRPRLGRAGAADHVVS